MALLGIFHLGWVLRCKSVLLPVHHFSSTTKTSVRYLSPFGILPSWSSQSEGEHEKSGASCETFPRGVDRSRSGGAVSMGRIARLWRPFRLSPHSRFHCPMVQSSVARLRGVSGLVAWYVEKQTGAEIVRIPHCSTKNAESKPGLLARFQGSNKRRGFSR